MKESQVIRCQLMADYVYRRSINDIEYYNISPWLHKKEQWNLSCYKKPRMPWPEGIRFPRMP